MFGFDPLYLILTLPGLLLGLYAQHKVKSTFAEYARVGISRGLSGAQTAQAILRAENIAGVSIERIEGYLSDHYDPTVRTLRLSPDVYDGRSVSAVGVAAHEVGHAIQHARGYAPLKMRSAIVPALQLTSNVAMPAIVIGFLLATMSHSPIGTAVATLGVALFGLTVVFQLVTLPVEFDASRRALVALDQGRIVQPEELRGARAVLSAAALTYVAAAVASLSQLLYFVLRLSALRGREDD